MAFGAPALASHLTRGLCDGYHRYMAEYCSADPRRLKSMVLAPATDPAWCARTIEQYADQEWVAAVWPLLSEALPIDDPDLDPIWAAANDADLGIMYHGFTIEERRPHKGPVDGTAVLSTAALPPLFALHQGQTSDASSARCWRLAHSGSGARSNPGLPLRHHGPAGVTAGEGGPPCTG